MLTPNAAESKENQMNIVWNVGIQTPFSQKLTLVDHL